MRTTLTIDDDVLAAARRLAQSQKKTLGEVISAVVRESLRTTRNGVPLLARRPAAPAVTLEIVNELRGG